ncbi:MAG: divergent polysaccharide deacetylase family protein [Deferribacterales bacterium]
MAERKKPARTPRKRRPAGAAKTASSKQLYILGGILAAVLVLLLGIFLGMKAAGKAGTADKKEVKTPLSSVQEEVVTKDNKSATTEEADKAIKLAMFNLGIDSEAIKSRKMDDGSIPVITYVISLPEDKKEELTGELQPMLEDMGFKTTLSDNLSASNENGSIILIFPAEKTEKPKDKEKPVVLPPNAPKMAVIIDDCGYSIPLAKRLAAIKYPVTFAILPYLPHDSETAEIARKAGKTVFLHFPMEPLSYPDTDPGKGAALLNMPPSIIEAQADNNVKQIGWIDGFNNHMGSAFTESETKMEQVLGFMKKHTDTFIDSYTTGKSAAYDVCLKQGMLCGQNRKFIDNENNETYIRKKIMEGVELAKKNGSLIMIGHLKDETVSTLEKHLADVEKAGVRIVSVKELVHRK